MRLGLYGGRFDPPHIGHLLVAAGARVALGLDRVLFIPSKAPPHKGTEASAQARYEMTLLATAENPQFFVLDLELKREGTSYSVDTVETLLEEYPDAELFYLTGVDAYADIATWQRAPDLVTKVQMVAYPRPGYGLEGLEPYFLERVKLLELPVFEVSSTVLRQRLRAGESMRYLLPDAVAVYIAKHEIYKQPVETHFAPFQETP